MTPADEPPLPAGIERMVFERFRAKCQVEGCNLVTYHETALLRNP